MYIWKKHGKYVLTQPDSYAVYLSLTIWNKINNTELHSFLRYKVSFTGNWFKARLLKFISAGATIHIKTDNLHHEIISVLITDIKWL
jgi:hypothetical protein